MRVLAALALTLCGFLAFSSTFAVANAPNIIIILADDMGWNDVGYHGSEISTPHIDQLAAEGLELDRFYAQPSCSPTRAALLSGKSTQSLGIYSPLSKLNPTGLPLTVKLMPEYFRDAGYQTFLAGKWHLGFHESAYRPTARGFDHFYGHLTGGIGYRDHVHGGGLDWQRNGETLREEGYSTHLLSAEIDRLIQQRDPEKPMFLYAAFNAPHLPNEAPEEIIAQYAHIEDMNRRVQAAMVSVSRFLEDWLGQPLPFTFLEFTRVNTLDGGSDNTPYRKDKQSVYEGGARVPSILYWKGQLSPGKSEQMLTVQDMLPTLLAATNVNAVNKTAVSATEFDGANQWLNVISETGGQAPDYLINGMDGEALYRYPWKLLALSSGEIELYRLDDDPTESVDSSGEHPDRVAQLQQALEEYPRGESVHIPTYRAAMDIDFFGGEEDRAPWSEIDSD